MKWGEKVEAMSREDAERREERGKLELIRVLQSSTPHNRYTKTTGNSSLSIIYNEKDHSSFPIPHS